MWLVIGFFIVHWILSLFTQTFFHHRYSSHKQFTMTRGWEKFFYVLSWLFQGSSYLSPRAYGIMHRMHHAYADTDKDPHSPKYDENPMAMMQRTRIIYKDIFDDESHIDKRFLGDLPSWRKFDVFASNNLVRLCWIIVYVLIYTMIAPAWYWYLLIPLHVIMGPLHGVVINWGAHKYGYTNFKVGDTSKNLFPIDIIMMGEGLHNNHHKHAMRYNFAWKKWEFDPTYPVIWMLDKLRIIKLKPLVASDIAP
ncbi:MAG: acyl-CoA desaturase [Bacteroidetes bacterium]|nr:MAG: acyl-CoA desaturase [Bacteroidota bacterium]